MGAEVKRRFFAQEFDGLNTAVAPHLIGHSEFQTAENVSYEEIGAAAPLGNDYDMWDSDTNVQALTHVRYGGEDHLIAVANEEVYQDGTLLNGLTGTTGTPAIVSDGDRIYILDGDGNRVYDGTNVRDHGAPAKPKTGTDGACVVLDSGVAVASTASTTPTVFECIELHRLFDGDLVRFVGVVGGTWDTLEGQNFSVTVIDEEHFSIDHDSSGYGLLSEANAIAVGPAASMSYQYAVSTVAVLAGGEEIESSLVPLWYLPDGHEATNGSPTRDPVVITSDQSVWILVSLNGNPLTTYVSPISGHTFKMIVYRTKGNGDTFYVMREIAASEMTSYSFSFHDSVTDSQLGATWLYDGDSNDTPPAGTMAVICQQQMFIAGDADNPDHLYFSGIGRYDYFAPSDYVKCKDDITALAEMGDRVAVFSDSGIGVWIPDESIGQYKRSLSPVGVENKEAVVSTSLGVFFARNDGLWLFDGNTATRVNEGIADLWPDGPWKLAYMTNRLVCVNGTATYTMDLGGGKMRWTTVTETFPQYVASAHDGSALYGLFSDGNVRTLFTTSERVMRVRTRNWGGGGAWRAMWVTVDADASYDFTVRVRSSSGQVYEAVLDSRSTRDRYRISVPRTIRGDYLSVEIEGRITVYQIELVVD